jgi:hypothetical protein
MLWLKIGVSPPLQQIIFSLPRLTDWLSNAFHRAIKSSSIANKRKFRRSHRVRYLIVKGMMRSLAKVHCELFVPPPNGVVLFKDVS